ncbi:MAG: Mur ligase family protein [Acidimicrobiales bacterium]
MSSSDAPGWAAIACCWAAMLPAGARWLRVAQREHYLAPLVGRFALRWWIGIPANLAVSVAAVAAVVLCWWFPLVGVAVAVFAGIGPLGLSVRGRTSRLALTARLRRLLVMWAALEAVVVVVGFALGAPVLLTALATAAVPWLVDAACALLAPLERRLASRFVTAASQRLAVIDPVVVAITGSYGKTSTKSYVAHLLSASFAVVASPASFNNRAGLSRAVNENLTEGTEVFVAEMGTYGPGEIAEMCSWCPPKVAVITAIGPVHLERFGSEDAILKAKAEITKGAEAIVLNVDDPRLARLADELSASVKVLRCSGFDRSADFFVLADAKSAEVGLSGASASVALAQGVQGVQPTNLACAVGVASHLGVQVSEIVKGIESLPVVSHRLALGQASSGVLVLDDTFNSNPAGASAALALLRRLGDGGRMVVVTPGMVELGPIQADANRLFAREALEFVSELIVVGRTNREALAGRDLSPSVLALGTREEAVRWVRENLGPGDAVLYENDLPDHYP